MWFSPIANQIMINSNQIQITSCAIKSNLVVTTRFELIAHDVIWIWQCSSQIKSPHVIQSWFKSNNNLDLPVSSTHFNHTLTSRNHHCYWKTAISRHQDHHHLLDWEKYHNDNLRSTTLAINRRNNSSLEHVRLL